MPRNQGICIVIADGGHARFVRPAEDNALHTIETVDSATVHKRTHDLVSGRQGRSFESASATRHAYTPRHDPHDLEKIRFAHLVARRVNQDSAASAFNELVLVAPAHVLREINDTLEAGQSEVTGDPGQGFGQGAG